jgi:hypothetical protein
LGVLYHGYGYLASSSYMIIPPASWGPSIIIIIIYAPGYALLNHASQTPKCTASACNLYGYNVSLRDSRQKGSLFPSAFPICSRLNNLLARTCLGGILERSKKKILVSSIQFVSLRPILLVLILDSYPILSLCIDFNLTRALALLFSLAALSGRNSLNPGGTPCS